MSLNKKILIPLICIALGIGAYFFYSSKNDEQVEFFFTSKPTTKDLKQYVNASGNLKAKEQITIGSLVAGKIVKILADDNDIVKKGDVLAELDDGQNYSTVKRALGTHEEALALLKYQKNFVARQEILFKSNQLAKNTFENYLKDLEITKAKVKQAEAQVELASQTYNNLFIKAPEDGIVIAKKIDLGQMITSVLQATELFVLAKNLKQMEVEVDIDEADVGMVKENQIAHFTVDAFPNQKFTGKVRLIRYLAKIVQNVVTYAAIVDVTNPDLKLRPGMTADVYVKVADAKDALCIPNRALRIYEETLEKMAKKHGYKLINPTTNNHNIIQEQEYIWIFDGKETFKKVPVSLGTNDGIHTEVISGINPNDLVITEAFDPDEENALLKSVFGKKGGIGS